MRESDAGVSQSNREEKLMLCGEIDIRDFLQFRCVSCDPLLKAATVTHDVHVTNSGI